MKTILYRRNFFVILMIFAVTGILTAQSDIAKYNLRQAYNFYMDDNVAAAMSLAARSYQYDTTLPEYYYLMNLMTADNEDNIHQKLTNSRAIVANISRTFFISELTMLRNAEANTYDRHELDGIYKRIISFGLPDDYLRYVDFLLRTRRYDLALQTIRQIQPTINSVLLKSYEVIARINTGNYDFASFTRDIKTLRSNKFNPSAILLYRAMYTNELPTEIVAEFDKMCQDGSIDVSYRLPILQAILSNETLQTPAENVTSYFDIEELDESETADYADTSNDEMISNLLSRWAECGGLGNDYTNQIVSIAEYERIINAEQHLSDLYNKYTGIRIADYDDNGVWESRTTYDGGLIVTEESDANQDGIAETMFAYDILTGNLNRIVLHNQTVIRDFSINSGDQSVISCRDIQNDGKREDYEITFMKSAFVISNNVSYQEQLTPKVYRAFIESIEYLQNEQSAGDFVHRKDIYTNGINTSSLIDEDNNGIFDRKIVYRGGKAAEMYRDLDEDGYYEVHDIYKDGKYVGTECRKDEFAQYPYYSEEVAGQSIIKRWDTNGDGHYDQMLTETPSRRPQYGSVGQWFVISKRNTYEVKVPQEIIITDADHNSGYYIHNNKKLIFKNGMLTDAPYNLEVRTVGHQIYLFDLNN